jgi:uncharacterized protein YlxP (DUF503 family)
MIVGAALVELHVHGSRSLKQKRGVVRSVVQRVRDRHNVSVAEVGGQDTWQRAVLGISTAGSEAARVRRTLERVMEFIESLHLAEVRATDVELLDLPQGEEALADSEADDGEMEPLPWEES